MRIAVISDTHNHLPDSVLDSIASADEIWHLGDVTDERILTYVRALGRPLKIVRGNCDSSMEWPMQLRFTVAGLNVQLIHIPPAQAPADTDLLLHGHTHVPRHEMVGKTVFLNPGCITRPNRGAPSSYAWLTLEEGKPYRWEVHPVFHR